VTAFAARAAAFFLASPEWGMNIGVRRRKMTPGERLW